MTMSTKRSVKDHEQAEGELTDLELEQVAGGFTPVPIPRIADTAFTPVHIPRGGDVAFTPVPIPRNPDAFTPVPIPTVKPGR